jgi:hypothetical protein
MDFIVCFKAVHMICKDLTHNEMRNAMFKMIQDSTTGALGHF